MPHFRQLSGQNYVPVQNRPCRISDWIVLVIPFGVEAIKTPYGGIFDVDAAIMVALLILVEWVLSILRNRS